MSTRNKLIGVSVMFAFAACVILPADAATPCVLTQSEEAALQGGAALLGVIVMVAVIGVAFCAGQISGSYMVKQKDEYRGKAPGPFCLKGETTVIKIHTHSDGSTCTIIEPITVTEFKRVNAP